MNPNGGTDPEHSESEIEMERNEAPASSGSSPAQPQKLLRSADENLVFLPPTAPIDSWPPPQIARPARIPNLGHLLVLALLAALGLLASSILVRAGLRLHLFGISSVQKAMTDIHYTLGSEVVLYVITLIGCLIVFPFIWHKSLFAGLQWNGATAFRMRVRLFGAAAACFIFAMLNAVFLPGPTNAPIDRIFRAPGAAWLMFVFGITVAPFFEEFFFRGFLLPALCTACDWLHERFSGALPRPLGENDHPQWSVPAMIIGSIGASIPFALMHAEQIGRALGPLALLVCVSLILCWTRLATRSLAASALVHASYNFLIFSFMLLDTGGFRHLDKM